MMMMMMRMMLKTMTMIALFYCSFLNIFYSYPRCILIFIVNVRHFYAVLGDMARMGDCVWFLIFALLLVSRQLGTLRKIDELYHKDHFRVRAFFWTA